MLSKTVAVAAAALSLLPSSSALYDPTKKTNLAMYWGQGPNQLPLVDFCNVTPADIIPIGFVNAYPPAANGYVGADYGNACWGEGYRYKGPGYGGKPPVAGQDLLPDRCPRVQDGIPKCQRLGKKILISIGGAAPTWNPVTQKNDKTYKGQLKNAADGEYFANFLWKAYGPYDPTWTGPRPLDRGYYNDTESIRIDIDGFDFDIEDTVAGTDSTNGETAAYIACINRLRTLMNAQTAKTGKKYLITASPQCTLNPKEKNMDAVILQAGFDILFVQFYNQGTISCTARSRASHKGPFNFTPWRNYINQAGSKSRGALIFVGLLGGPTGSSYAPGDYLNVAETQNLIKTYGRDAQFGGVMLWDATAAFNNRNKDLPVGKKYWHVVKDAMVANFPTSKKRDEENLEIVEESVEIKRDEQHVEHVEQARRHAHMARHQHKH